MDLSQDLRNFIENHIHESIDSIFLKYHNKPLPFSLEFAVAQIKGRQKGKLKLSNFISNPNFLFPDLIAVEQASDQLIAEFHASLIPSGCSVLDLTAGLGIDALTLSITNHPTSAIEINPLKAEILQHNSSLFPDSNLNVICGDAIEWLKTHNNQFDAIFVDPARRGEQNKRIYSLRDSQPNIIENYDLIMNHTNRLIIKGSPLLDFSAILNDLPATMLYAISVNGECKEVLIDIVQGDKFKGITFIDINNKGDLSSLHFCAEECDDIIPVYATIESIKPGSYLYEPSPNLMKFTAYGALCSRFPNLHKLDTSTSLYVSEQYHQDFPGRVSVIRGKLDKKDVNKIRGGKYNVVTRNYPISTVELRKKLSVKEGSTEFIHGCKVAGKPILIHSSVTI